MSSGSLKLIDTGLRSLLYSRFYSILSLPSVSEGVILCPKETALRKFAEKKGKTQLEFINFMRVGIRKDLARSRTPVARRGMTMSYTDISTKTSTNQVKAVPVNLDYDIRFWSQDLDRLNEVIESFLFWKFQNPNLDMVYDKKFSLEFDLLYGNEIVDESTTEFEYERGKYHVFKTSMIVEGWVFEGIFLKPIHKIILTFWDENDLESPYTEVLDSGSSEYDVDLAATLKIFTRTYK